MAVGKGSRARASKAAATKKEDGKAAVVNNVEEKVVEAVVEKAVEKVKEDAPKAAAKKAAPKKTTKKAAPKKEETVAASAVVEATSEQVLNRKPEVNETCGIGEEMPIYLF